MRLMRVVLALGVALGVSPAAALADSMFASAFSDAGGAYAAPGYLAGCGADVQDIGHSTGYTDAGFLVDGVLVPFLPRNSPQVIVVPAGASTLACQATFSFSDQAPETLRSADLPIHALTATPIAISSPTTIGPTAPMVGDVVTCTQPTYVAMGLGLGMVVWFRDGASFRASAFETTYTVVKYDIGHSLSCGVYVTGSPDIASASVSHEVTARALAAPVAIQKPYLDVTPVPYALPGVATCEPGTWHGGPSLGYSWTVDGRVVARAHGPILAIPATWRGRLVRCVVVATNVIGRSTSTTAGALVVPPSGVAIFESPGPVTTVAQPGDVVDCRTADSAWVGGAALTRSFAWDANGTPIAGATPDRGVGPTDVGKTLTCTETRRTATNTVTTAVLAVTVHPAGASDFAVARIVQPTGLAVAVGDRLTCAGRSDGGAVFSYRWVIDPLTTPVVVSVGDEQTFTVPRAAAGHRLACEVTAENGVDSLVGDSEPVDVITLPTAPPVRTKAPAVTGTFAVGKVLKALPGSWRGRPTFLYQWLRDGIPVAVGARYRVARADRHHRLSVRVWAWNRGGETLAESKRTSVS